MIPLRYFLKAGEIHTSGIPLFKFKQWVNEYNLDQSQINILCKVFIYNSKHKILFYLENKRFTSNAHLLSEQAFFDLLQLKPHRI